MTSTSPAFAPRLALPQVTLCAASSVNVAATVRALEACVAQVEFARCKLFTDQPVDLNGSGITVVPIAEITSAQAYSHFVLTQMVDHVETSHCLVVQWDGHVLDASRWRAEFLDHDYIGAVWPQFDDAHVVGNGGFSLRSRKLMQACREPGFRGLHPEDIMIGRENRAFLESRGFRFAPRALAQMFSVERAGDPMTSFGYHGAWHMPRVLGVESFWQIYCGMDDRSAIWHDFAKILIKVGQGSHGWARMMRLIADRLIADRFFDDAGYIIPRRGDRRNGRGNAKPRVGKDQLL
jgi:hypothetical protein